MKTPSHPRSLALTLLLGSLVLSGCSSLNNVSVSDPAADNTLVQGTAAQGTVLGGHAPIVGSHVYLLQPSTSGMGKQSTSLLTASTTGAVLNTTDPNLPNTWYYVPTNSSGAFNISSSANCTSGQPLYLYAYGGTSLGATANTTATNNPAIVNLATLGNCGSTSSSTYIYLNEVSTVATAYAFQGFTSPATSTTAGNNASFISSSNSTQAELGISHAALTAGELYSIDGHFTSSASDGEGHIANPSTLTGNGIVPQATIDTLANILAGCIDSSNTSTTHNAACYDLFALATSTGTACTEAATPVCPTGTYAPIDTATAIINIARHPAGLANANFVSTIYGLQTGTVPYVPNLTTQPNDFTLAIQYKGTANTDSNGTQYLNSAESVQVDGNGLVWITSQGTSNATAAAFQWTSQGVLSSNVNSNGYIYGYVSIDGNNNAWTGNANDAAGTGITEFNANGQAVNTYGSADAFVGAYTVVTDATGDVFFGASTARTPTNTNGNQDLFTYTTADTSGGTNPQFYSLNSSGFTGGGLVSHGGIDASGDLWLTGEANENITRVSQKGALEGDSCGFIVATSCFPVDTPTVTANSLGLNRGTTVYQPQPEFPAINSAGDAVIPIQTIYSGSTGGTAQSVPGVYVVSPNGNTVTQLYSGTCTNGCAGTSGGFGATIYRSVYTGANFYQSFGSAVDGNNNIWITNRYNASLGGANTTGNGNSTLIELNGSTYAAISPSTNYIPSNGATATPIMNDALNLAIDPSGNIWITNYTGNQVVEVVGAAIPVVTPLSVAAGNSAFGIRP